MRKMLLFSFTLAGCMLHAYGGGIEAAAALASPRSIDACSLLQPAEIERVTALAVEAGRRKDAGRGVDGAYSSSCVWVIKQAAPAPVDPALPLGGRDFIILNAMQWPAGSGLARTFLDAFREAAMHGDIPSAPVPRNFGDEGLSWGDGLAVRRYDVSFGISVFIRATDKVRRAEYQDQLAPLILRQLDERDARVDPE